MTELRRLLARPAPLVAPDLIGWELEAHGVRGRITEAEAYQGEADRACHACKGRTRRTETLYAAPGTLYIYLCYGMHALLNLVCDREGVPAAVLIRSLEIVDGVSLARRRRGLKEEGRGTRGEGRGSTPVCLSTPDSGPRTPDDLTNGPAKVCQALGLVTAHNGLVLGEAGCPLRLLPPMAPAGKLRRGPRVGVAYAGPIWARKPWRWWEDGFPMAGIQRG